jgi:hypothetical protein
MRRLALALAAVLLLAMPGSALARDRDRDRLPDRWEKKHKLSQKRASGNSDLDRDRVDNWNEWREGTNPRKRDSDRDGRPDGREDRDRDGLSNAGEDATGNDPRDRDSDADGVRDGKERAGTIASYVDGALDIDLAVGGSVTGLVTDATKIKCTTEAETERRHRKSAARAATGDESGELGDDDELTDEELEEEDLTEWDEDWLDDGGGSDGEGKGGTRRCTAAALKRGAKVRKARMELTEDGLVFEKIELLR